MWQGATTAIAISFRTQRPAVHLS